MEGELRFGVKISLWFTCSFVGCGTS